MSAPDRIRTDELAPGDRIWHPFDIVCFTVAHKPRPETKLHFEGEPGLRVTGTSDRGETVHVDVAPAYIWHRGPVAAAEPVSTPMTHDPLVVNTKDGAVWTRRAVTRQGRGLYVVADAPRCCPEYVMATLADLAEHGIAGSADALPMPVGPEPLTLTAEQRSAIAALIGDAKPATTGLVQHMAKAVHDRSVHEHPTWEDMYCLNLVSWMGERMGPVLRRLVDAEARVAELESASVARSVDRWTRFFTPVQALREDGAYPQGSAPRVQQRVEWCTGCNTDHNPDECGYRPESGGAR